MDAKIDKLTDQQSKLAEHQAKLESKLDGACEQIARNTEILETFFQPLAATVEKQSAIVEDLVTKVDDHTTDIKLLKKLAVGL